MKLPILSAAALLLAAAGYAQGGSSALPGDDVPAAGSECREWLAPFERVEVDAAASIRFEQVSDGEAPSIRYDTQGDDTKFRAEVRDGVLRIRERIDLRRSRRTAVTVRYHTLRALTLTDAAASVEGVLTAVSFDLRVGARSSLQAELDVQDLWMELSGDSRAVLTGRVRYLTLDASTGSVEAAGMTCMSARVSAQNKARVRIQATDRLESRATTGAAIENAATPVLHRNIRTFWQRASDRAAE
ncbi:MAG: DUF2807 domain-containing protein [Alistipes sp.]|nr:DUF2807 domain-containing protein [Alistipes senegalensis]MCM1250218.1 DUF2807 domain-containing protein [Alistipes sp.]